jgi:hypothetical protein
VGKELASTRNKKKKMTNGQTIITDMCVESLTPWCTITLN